MSPYQKRAHSGVGLRDFGPPPNLPTWVCLARPPFVLSTRCRHPPPPSSTDLPHPTQPLIPYRPPRLPRIASAHFSLLLPPSNPCQSATLHPTSTPLPYPRPTLHRPPRFYLPPLPPPRSSTNLPPSPKHSPTIIAPRRSQLSHRSTTIVTVDPYASWCHRPPSNSPRPTRLSNIPSHCRRSPVIPPFPPNSNKHLHQPSSLPRFLHHHLTLPHHQKLLFSISFLQLLSNHYQPIHNGYVKTTLRHCPKTMLTSYSPYQGKNNIHFSVERKTKKKKCAANITRPHTITSPPCTPTPHCTTAITRHPHHPTPVHAWRARCMHDNTNRACIGRLMHRGWLLATRCCVFTTAPSLPPITPP